MQPEVQEVYKKLAERHGLTEKDIHKIHMHTWRCIRFSMSNVCGKVLIQGLGTFRPWKKRIEIKLKLYWRSLRAGVDDPEYYKEMMRVLFFSRRHTKFFKKQRTREPYLNRKKNGQQSTGNSHQGMERSDSNDPIPT